MGQSESNKLRGYAICRIRQVAAPAVLQLVAFSRFNDVSEILAPRNLSIDRSIARSIARLFVFSFARSPENFSKNSLRRRDQFGPKIVKIGAILAIFRPFGVGGAKI